MYHGCIILSTITLATVLANLFLIGTAIKYLENTSVAVNNYEYPFDMRYGLDKSIAQRAATFPTKFFCSLPLF